VSSDWSEPLAALRWHWGEAYIINCLGLGTWIAERRDTRETLRDETPLGLRDKIIADYTARPVSRDLPDQQGPLGEAIRARGEGPEVDGLSLLWAEPQPPLRR
jgi:hypothetical protein